MDRRKMLKTLGGGALLAGVAPYIITSKTKEVQAAEVGGDIGINGKKVIGPPTKPWVQALPIPASKKPQTKMKGKAPDTRGMQFYNIFPAVDFYEFDVKEVNYSFHPDLPLNKMWGYDGLPSASKITAHYGRPVMVRFHNNLPKNHKGWASTSMTTHLHNGHTGSESDGFTTDFHGPGTYRDHHYPQMLSGGDEREEQGTLWFHDHMMDFTSHNTYKGLAGLYTIFSEKDSGDEQDTNGKALRLPSGDYDIPLVFSDRQFDKDGTLFFDPADMNGFVGDRIGVNGALQPFFKVARRKYRFRILATGPARWYGYRLSDGSNFTLVATDGNLLEKPIVMNKILGAPAERWDIIIDFSKYKKGDKLYMEDYVEMVDGRGPIGTKKVPFPMLRFDIDSDAKDESRVLLGGNPVVKQCDYPDMLPVKVVREMKLENEDGMWTVNGRLFDPEHVEWNIEEGVAEQWNITSLGDWGHPMHIHREEFRILSRDGKAVRPEESGRKDMVKLLPIQETGLGSQSTVSLYVRFNDMLGKYMSHCHNVVHEDHAMMIRFDVHKAGSVGGPDVIMDPATKPRKDGAAHS